jgi:hypothetical protein
LSRYSEFFLNRSPGDLYCHKHIISFEQLHMTYLAEKAGIITCYGDNRQNAQVTHNTYEEGVEMIKLD